MQLMLRQFSTQFSVVLRLELFNKLALNILPFGLSVNLNITPAIKDFFGILSGVFRNTE